MPGLDGTGPLGRGSGTGRGLGRCNPASDTINKDNIYHPMGGAFGRGFGCGTSRGAGGRGFRRNRRSGQPDTHHKEEK